MSSFLQGLSADEAAALVRLRIIKDLPKSRYATRPAVMALDKRGKKVIYSHIEVYKMVSSWVVWSGFIGQSMVWSFNTWSWIFFLGVFLPFGREGCEEIWC